MAMQPGGNQIIIAFRVSYSTIQAGGM